MASNNTTFDQVIQVQDNNLLTPGLNIAPVDYNLLLNQPNSFLLYYSKGDGSDGDVTISGTETLYRDMYYNNLTVPSTTTLITNGYSICVKGTLLNQGTISYNGNNGTSASLYTGGTGGAALNVGTIGVNYGGKNGGNGGIGPSTTHINGLAGDNSNPSYSNTNAVAGASGGDFLGGLLNNGGTAGTATRGVNYNQYLNIAQSLSQFSMPTRVYNTTYNGLPSSGGAGGGQHNGNLTAGGGGGGNGGNGGIIVIHCSTYIGTGVIESKGGTGGNGANGQNNGGGVGAGGGGGGSGGSGGVIFFTYTSGVSPTTTVTGGAGGTPGANSGYAGALAQAGFTGSNGTTIIINK